MKKILAFLFFIPFILLTACANFSGQSSQGRQVTTTAKEGYRELTGQVYVSSNIDSSHTEVLPAFDTKKGNEETLIAATLSFLGDGAVVTEVEADRSSFKQIQNADFRADIVVNKSGSWLLLDTPASSDVATVFHSLLWEAINNNLDVTDFAGNLPFSKEESVGKVEDFLSSLQLGFEDYDYLVYSVSKESLLTYLPTYEQKAMELKGTKVVVDNMTDSYYITVYPKLSAKRVIDEGTQLGSPGEISYVRGASVNFIVTEAGIQWIDLSGLILPTQKIDQVSTVSVQKGLEGLENKYQDLILEHPVYIEDYTIEYVPIPVQEGEIYGGNLYRPFLIFKVQENDHSYKVVIDPDTGKEVG